LVIELVLSKVDMMIDFKGLLNVFKPKEVEGYFKKEMPNAQWSGVVTNVLLGMVIVTIASFIVALVQTMFQGVLMTMGGAAGQAVVSGAANLGGVLVGAVMNFILFFVFAFILHFIARAMGGKGEALKLLYLMSIASLALSPIWAVIQLLMIIPCINCLMLIVGFGVLLYELYLIYEGVMVSHGLESNKALIAVAAWVIVLLIIAAVIIGAMMLFIGATMFGAGALSGMSPTYYP